MFTFTPKTDAELNTASLLPKGEYDFEVMAAVPKTSKAGNPMLELNLRVWGNEGQQAFVYDYLLESIAYKIKHFCGAVGMQAEYLAGQFNPSDCIGRGGRAKIGIQADKTGNYGDKNVVTDYIPAPAGSVLGVPAKPAATNAVGQFIEDSIPF